MKLTFAIGFTAVVLSTFLGSAINAHASGLEADRSSMTYQDHQERHWLKNIGPGPIVIGEPEVPKRCSQVLISRLKRVAESEAVSRCQEAGAQSCRLRGTVLVKNGLFGKSECELASESNNCWELTVIKTFGCIVRATAVGEI